MISVFARIYNIITGKSLFINSQGTASLAEGQYSSVITNSSLDGISGQAWIYPQWASGGTGGGVPNSFMGYWAADGNAVTYPYIILGYDTETASDAVFIMMFSQNGELDAQSWFYAPVCDDPFDPSQFNQTITGINQSGTGHNSWNNSTTPGFVHLAWVLDAQAPAVSNGQISQRGVIYWNGQKLRTYESYGAVGGGSSNPNSYTLSHWNTYDCKFGVGTYFFGQEYNIDRAGLMFGKASNTDVTDWYNGGNPTSLPAGLDLHYNFEDPNNYANDGAIVYNISTLTASGGNSSIPNLDPNNYK